ncbi:MAG: hypothetical protein HDR13_16105 [Lachnospiraceae bacterium]|nr:hypothetical protein [Lachnospiraceae bacterium]
MTLRELYDYLIDNYGNRKCWISELATDLNIPYTDANHLTYVLGYRRGKVAVLSSYEVFSNDERVRRIQAFI